MKNLKYAVLLCVFSSCAFAQEPPKEYNLNVTSDDLNLISDGLGYEPLNKALPLINKLRGQFIAQQPKPEPSKVEQPKPEVPKAEVKPAEPETKPDGSSQTK